MKPGSNKIAKYQSGNMILKSTEELGPLILGDCNSAMDKKIHKQFKVQTVISIGQQAMPIKQKLPQNCKHFFFDIHDNKSQKVSAQLFDEINKLIEQGRQSGGVLVHCYAGVSRSSTFVIAYVMQKFLKSYDEAKLQVKNARNCIYPNDGFINHLKNYQKVIQFRQQQRLRKIQQQKNRLIEQSLVQSARKSIRGGVRGAAMSPQKVKQINDQKQNKSFQFIIEPLILNQHRKTAKQVSKGDELAKFKNNTHHISQSVKQNKIKQKVKPSKSIFLAKSFSISQKPKQQIKLPKVKESSHTERSKVQRSNIENRYTNKKVQKQIQKKSQSIPLFIRKQKQQNAQKDTASNMSTQSKPKSHTTTIRQSKSVISNKRQKPRIIQIDESLLNDHQKQIKKIYQSKIIVK